MTGERHRAVITQHHEHMNSRDITVTVQDYAEDARNHGRTVGREGVRRVFTDFFRTFPDMQVTIVDMLADGDDVVVRCTVSGTHRGTAQLPVMGGMLVWVAPTGKRFEVQQIHWYTLRDGKIAEHWANRDDIGMMRHLGLLPETGARD